MWGVVDSKTNERFIRIQRLSRTHNNARRPTTAGEVVVVPWDRGGPASVCRSLGASDPDG